MDKELEKIIRAAIILLQKDKTFPFFELPKIEVTYPKDEQFGDYTTNVAMTTAKLVGKNPTEIAELIASKIKTDIFSKIEAIKPGYINFFLSEKHLQKLTAEINIQKEIFGENQSGKGVKVCNEFISANPTGPLHLGNGRGGFYGDSISKVLKKSGFEVTNEYYINDAGEQILKLGHSVLKDREAEYAGGYLDDLNEQFKNISDVREVGEKAADLILKNYIQKTITEKMKINFDVWISERKDLEEKGYIEKAINVLKEKKLTYEEGGALWLRTSDFGDDKDRVLQKKDGERTYFASDCGYILSKMDRGFSRLVEIWGADHHGYVDRFKAAASALGFKGELKFIIVQLVRLSRDGGEVKMSKRAGNVIYIDELIDAVGQDVCRFFFLMYSPDTHLNFDMKLAKESSAKNPIFYVQYAHARICSILRKAKSELGVVNFESGDNLDKLNHLKELNLMRELNKFPKLIEEISQNYEVYRLPLYAVKIADKLHSFYDACLVIDKKNSELTQARLKLVNAVRIVLAETLRLIGVAAPEKM